MLARAGRGVARPCAVYGAYNHAGELIYVGISVNPNRRWEQHECDKPWIGEVKSWAILEWLPTSAAARARETYLIRTLRTRWNIDESPVGAEVRQRYLTMFGWAPKPKPRNLRPWPLRALLWTLMAVWLVVWTFVSGTVKLAWAVLRWLVLPRRRRRRRWWR
jgi:predicted GIY-YIG superfamily endonuclease